MLTIRFLPKLDVTHNVNDLNVKHVRQSILTVCEISSRQLH